MEVLPSLFTGQFIRFEALMVATGVILVRGAHTPVHADGDTPRITVQAPVAKWYLIFVSSFLLFIKPSMTLSVVDDVPRSIALYMELLRAPTKVLHAPWYQWG